MNRILLISILLIVTAHAGWSFYQDYPSVTGFYDHTVVCGSMAGSIN